MGAGQPTALPAMTSSEEEAMWQMKPYCHAKPHRWLLLALVALLACGVVGTAGAGET
jgi:hypothetical protein